MSDTGTLYVWDDGSERDIATQTGPYEGYRLATPEEILEIANATQRKENE